MGWSLVSSSLGNGQGSGASTFLKPAGVADGDLLVCIEYASGAGFNFFPGQFGFTAGPTLSFGGTPQLHISTSAKVASSESDYSLPSVSGSTVFYMIALVCYRWTHAAATLSGVATAFRGTTCNQNAVASPANAVFGGYSVSGADPLCVYAMASRHNGAGSVLTNDAGLGLGDVNFTYTDFKTNLVVAHSATADSRTDIATHGAGNATEVGGLLVCDTDIATGSDAWAWKN